MLRISKSQFSEEISEEMLTREAFKYLQFFKLKAGMLQKTHEAYSIDPWDAEPDAFGPLLERDDAKKKFLYENPYLPFDDFENLHPPTARLRIAEKAWELAISNLTRVKPKLLVSECWDIYNHSRDQGPYDIETRKGRRVYASNLETNTLLLVGCSWVICRWCDTTKNRPIV